RRGVTPPPRSSLSRDGLADSITRVNGAQPADTVRSAPPSLDEQTTPGVIEEVEALDWDEEEESTHVFHSSHPPPRSSTPERWAPPPNASRVSTARGMGPNAAPEPSPSRERPLHVATAPPPSRRAEAQMAAFAATAQQFNSAALASPPSTDTLRLDAFEQRVQEVAPMPSRSGSSPPAFSQPGAQPMFPPPPPIPSITQARAFDQSAPGINPAAVAKAEEVVRDVPFVRLPAGNPHTATELAIRKPVLPPSTDLRSNNFGAVITHLPDAPRSDPKKWLLGAAGAAALLSIAGLVAFLFTRRPGGLQIEVRDASGATMSKAEVAVDGRKVCDASPCVIKDLDPGRHVVSVMGETGIEPLSVEVVAGEVSPVSMTAKSSNSATLVASSDQPGLRIFIDNVDKGPLPAKLADIPPGKHEVRIAGDRYKAFEKSVEVKAGETLDLNPPKLAVVKGRATINVKTEGVSITMVRNDETSKAKPLDGPFPRLVDVDTASGTWKLVAKKKGY
ncbi:MAG: PEGA domain-containing protein, partial [Myxococcales bacterium]|nr:PEGA domain-containing protein [Myxococcales bacterium]